MATHSSTLAWKIPGKMEEPDRLQSMGSLPGCSLWVWGSCGQANRGASMGLIGAAFSDVWVVLCWKRQI